MSFNNRNIIFISLATIIISIPFLEFIAFNLNIINERTDLRINTLTIKRIFSLYLLFFFIFMIAFFSLRKKIKTFDALVYLSFLYWIIFKYNDLKKIFNIEFLSSLRNYDGFLSLILTILIIILFTKKFFKKKNNFLNILITFFFIINFIYLSSLIIFKKDFQIRSNQQSFEFEKINVESSTRQNIYLFIVDAMPPVEIADKVLNTNSNQFLNQLSTKGFTYIKNSQSLYGNTFFTLGSIFNLKPLEKIDNKLGDDFNNLKYPKLTFPTLLRKNNTSNLEYNLQKLGYDLKWIGSHFANCYGYNSSYCIDSISSSNILFNYENLSFLKKTAFQPIMSYTFKILDIDIEKKIIFKSNNAIDRFNKFLNQNGKPNKPTFVLIHHLISHWPYLVDSDCNYEKNYGRLNKVGIKKTFECNKKLITDITNTINDVDKDSIVLIQSDHNWELSYHDPDFYGDRRDIFNLIKTNNFCKEYDRFAKNNINAIRLALYCATNTKPFFLNN
mgnify:CR=1 FL=1